MRYAHTMIRVKNLDASLAFYTEVLDMTETGRKDIGEEATLVYLGDDTEGKIVELTHNKDGREYTLGNQFGHLAFTTPDLEKLVKKIERRGLSYRRSRPELNSHYIFIKDPDGYDIEILQAKD
ncbi:MAG: VOC family protein [Acidobacteriota bacterium]|nr:VOC family protein [Acidobacteriota bacterium]